MPKPWTKKQILEARTKDVAVIRAADPRLKRLKSSQIEKLWSWFSDDLYCAGWLIVDVGHLTQFVKWAFASPFEAVTKGDADAR